MKKIFAILWIACSVALVACGNDDEEVGNKWFFKPVTNVSGTTVTVACRTKLASEALGAMQAGVVYMPLTSGGATVEAQNVAVNGTEISCHIEGLAPKTLYVIYVYVKSGSEKMESEPAVFETGESGDSPDPGDPDTPDEPDPTPPPGDGKYAGWAELPTEISNSDYRYAYHLCPDVNVPGKSQKRRNYTVCYSASLKCAIWVAAPMHTCYSEPNASRTNAYKPDPNISVSQPGSWSGYTRGHMLGSAERLVSKATNQQVFYHSNIAPQYGQPYFNTGGGAWNTLEGWVDTQWENNADTTYQVIGSYWKTKNKVVNGTTIPTHYYKVLLRTKGHKNKWVSSCSRDELQCIAIMVEHRTYSKSEVPQPSQYESKGMLYTVKQMEEMTGLKFFTNVPNAPKDTYNRADWGL